MSSAASRFDAFTSRLRRVLMTASLANTYVADTLPDYAAMPPMMLYSAATMLFRHATPYGCGNSRYHTTCLPYGCGDAARRGAKMRAQVRYGAQVR